MTYLQVKANIKNNFVTINELSSVLKIKTTVQPN